MKGRYAPAPRSSALEAGRRSAGDAGSAAVATPKYSTPTLPGIAPQRHLSPASLAKTALVWVLGGLLARRPRLAMLLGGLVTRIWPGMRGA